MSAQELCLEKWGGAVTLGALTPGWSAQASFPELGALTTAAGAPLPASSLPTSGLPHTGNSKTSEGGGLHTLHLPEVASKCGFIKLMSGGASGFI